MRKLSKQVDFNNIVRCWRCFDFCFEQCRPEEFVGVIDRECDRCASGATDRARAERAEIAADAAWEKLIP